MGKRDNINLLLIILIFVFTFVIISLSGYIMYDKLVVDEKQKEIEENLPGFNDEPIQENVPNNSFFVN